MSNVSKRKFFHYKKGARGRKDGKEPRLYTFIITLNQFHQITSDGKNKLLLSFSSHFLWSSYYSLQNCSLHQKLNAFGTVEEPKNTPSILETINNETRFFMIILVILKAFFHEIFSFRM